MNNNRKNHNKKRRNNRSNNQARSANPSGQNRRPSRNNKRRNQNRNRNTNKKPLNKNVKSVKLSKFHQLFSEYLDSRNLYYHSFRGTVTKKVERLHKKYTTALKRFWDYKNNLPENEIKKLNYELDFYPNDNQYSSGRPDEKALEASPEQENHIVLFHETLIQKQRDSFKGDTEESVGTMDDYQKYKENP